MLHIDAPGYPVIVFDHLGNPYDETNTQRLLEIGRQEINTMNYAHGRTLWGRNIAGDEWAECAMKHVMKLVLFAAKLGEKIHADPAFACRWMFCVKVCKNDENLSLKKRIYEISMGRHKTRCPGLKCEFSSKHWGKADSYLPLFQKACEMGDVFWTTTQKTGIRIELGDERTLQENLEKASFGT